MISRAKTGEPVFHGKTKDYPSIEEFKDFFLKKRISFNQRTEYNSLLNRWYSAQSVLYRIIQENNSEILHPYVKELFDYAKSTPSCKLSQQVSKFVGEFWDNHRKLHPRLKQCPCCGSFWIAENVKKRGRGQKYCSKDCETRFNFQSRVKDICSKKRSREVRKTVVRARIIKWLTYEYFEQNKAGAFRQVTKARAEEIYNELPEKAKTSMKEFSRIWAKPRWY